MLGVEPDRLEFKNVRLNQAYSTSLCITNNADTSMEFILRATSPRYSISPNRVRLDAGKAIVVTVRLFVAQANPNSSTEPKVDSLVLKCHYSEQRLPVSYTLFKQPVGSSRAHSRSRSPAGARRSKSPVRTPQLSTERHGDVSQRPLSPERPEVDQSRYMRSTSASRGRTESSTSPMFATRDFSSPPPSPPRASDGSPIRGSDRVPRASDGLPIRGSDMVPRAEYDRVCSALETERLMFEQRSEKVVRVLEKKDLLIRELRSELASLGGKEEFERGMAHPTGVATNTSSLDATAGEMTGMREKILDQSEQIEALISEVARLRTELADNSSNGVFAQDAQNRVEAARQPPISPSSDHQRLSASVDSYKRKIVELEADLYSERFKIDATQKENESLRSQNAYLEGECSSLSSQLRQVQQSLYQALEEKQQNDSHSAAENLKSQVELEDERHRDGDTSVSVGPEVFSLYQERAKRAETDNGILHDHISRVEREYADMESTCLEFSQKLQEKDAICGQLMEKCAELEAIVNVARSTPKLEIEETPAAPAPSGPNVSIDADGSDLKDANIWWSYVWHAMGQSDSARMEREHDAAANMLAATDVAEGSSTLGANSLNNYTEAIARLQRNVNDLKATTSAQVIEIAVARQNLLSNRLKHRNEMDSLREELDLSRRELNKVMAREKAHRSDGEIKIAELANTVRMLSGKSDSHAIAAAARQDLLAEQLTVHHLRADVEAYRSLLDAEQVRITTLKRDFETSKSLLDASSVVETVMNIPGVSAQKVIETFAVKVFKLEHQLKSSHDEVAKLKLKIGDGFTATEARGDTLKVRGSSLNGLLVASTPHDKGSRYPRRGRSASPSATKSAGQSGKRRALSTDRDTGRKSESLSGAEYRVRSNVGTGGDSDSDNEVYAPPVLKVPSPGDHSNAAPGFGDVSHIWEALAPCVQNRSSESVVDSLNSALMARRLVLQADLIRDLESKVQSLEQEKTDILDEKMKEEVDENDRTRIDLDTCNRRLELSENTQKLAVEDLRRARDRIVELEKEATQYRLFGSCNNNNSNNEQRNNILPKSGRFYEYMTDSDEDDPADGYGGANSPLNTSSDSDKSSHIDHKRLSKRLRKCERDLSDSKDLLRERTLQLKILMQTVEAVQRSSVASSTFADRGLMETDVNAAFDLEDIARAPLGVGGQGMERVGHNSSGNQGGDGPSGLEALVKRVVELTTELSSQTAATGLLEHRVNELEIDKRKISARCNILKANNLAMTDELMRYAAENNTFKEQLRDKEFASLEGAAAAEKEVERVLSALRESEAEVESLKISLENMSKQIDATDHRAFMRWMEDVVLNEESWVKGASHGSSPSKRNAVASADEEIDTGRESSGKGEFEGGNDSTSSVKSLIISLLVQWREQAGFYPRGATGPITKSEQRFLQRISDLVLASHERCERALGRSRAADEERSLTEQKYALMKTRLSLCTQQLHRYLRRTDFSERVISIERKHVIRANERLLSLFRNNHMDVLTTMSRLRQDLYAEQSKLAKVRIEKNIQTSRSRQLQCRVAELESQLGGTASAKIRELVTAALQKRVQTVEDTLHKWFKAELPRILSGLPINEDDISMRNMFTDGDVLMYPLYSSVAASSDYMIHSQSKSYAMAQALCSSKAVQAAAEFRASGLMERNSVLKDRIMELEGIIMRWRAQIDSENTQQLEDITSGASEDNSAATTSSERLDFSSVLRDLADTRAKHLDAEERAAKLSCQLEQCQERSEAMRKLAEHLRKEEREERTYTAHQLTELRLRLEEQHANELKDLRMSYEAEKAHLGNELAMVAEAIRREVSHDSRDNGDSKFGDDGYEHKAPPRPYPSNEVEKNTENEEKLREEDIVRRKEALLQTLNNGILQPEKEPSITSASTGIGSEVDSASVMSSEGIDEQPKKRSATSSRPSAKGKKNVRLEVITKQLTETTRQLASLQRSYETAQNQIGELEQLLESQRLAFQLNHSNQQSPRAAPPNHASHQMNAVAETASQTEGYSNLDSRIMDDPIEFSGPLKSMPTVDSLANEMLQHLRGLHSRHYSWMQALERSSYLQSNVDASALHAGSADTAMIASEFVSQIRILMSLTEKMKLVSEKHILGTREAIVQGTKPENDHATSLKETYPETGVSEELQRLVQRVRDVENVLINERSIPEQHLLALRELRSRCSGMEQLYNEELSIMQREWEDERNMLKQQVLNLESILATERAESSNQAVLLRERYESALAEVQESMELQTNATGEQLSNLHDLLNVERAKFAEAMEERELRVRREETELDRPAGESAADELSRLKQMFGAVESELQESKTKLQGLQGQHRAEMDNLREHFRKYRLTQQEVVAALEAQLSELTHSDNDLEDMSDLGADNTYVSYNQEFGAGVSPQEAQAQMNRLAAKHRLRRLELNAILKAISSAGASVSSDQSSAISLPSINIPGGHPGPQSASINKDVDAWSMGGATRIIPLREELLEARVMAADKEMESLHESLERERRACMALRAQLSESATAVADASDSVDAEGKSAQDVEFSLPANFTSSLGDDDKKTVLSFVRRVNNYKRSTRKQLTELKKELKEAKDMLSRDDSGKLKAHLSEIKAEVNSLREENARKAKLLATFKATRSADFNAIEQWRHEASEMEDKIKHMKSSLASKDSIIKDLKNRISAVESAAEGIADSGDGGDYSSMSPAELKNRLKSSDLEIKRYKMRLAAFREKVVDLERVVEPLKAENDRLSQYADKVEALKSAVSRKDSLLKNYKEQAERSKADFDALKDVSESRRLDLERKNKNLRKQLDDCQESFTALQRESSLTKKRLMAAAENAARGTQASQKKSAQHIPIGDMISPHEAALPSVLPTDRSSSRTRNAGYQAPTISHSNKLRLSSDTHSDSPIPLTRQPTQQSPLSEGNDSAPASPDDGFKSLRPEEVPHSVDIPLSELNDILRAVGGLSNSSRSDSSKADIWNSSPPPGSVPVGPSYVSGRADSSSDSSTLSVERRLQQLVDSALLPEPVVHPPPNESEDSMKYTSGTRMSIKRKSSSTNL